MIPRRADAVLVGIAVAFVALALVRPVDHDESQYVAAAVLTAAGRLPYLDYAYLQTPLQPFALAPIAWLAGAWAWPALRVANALFATLAVWAVRQGAVAEGADPGTATMIACLFACCDILLFSAGVARNDALPAACFAWAIALIADRRRGGWRAAMAGALLALAAAAKISYALPASAYGAYALLRRDHRPLLVLAGAAPVLLFVAWAWRLSPEGFTFGTVDFPARAPAQWYADRPWRLSLPAKALDALKFLALGAALPALFIVARDAFRRQRDALDVLLAAGLLAALLPSPTWRQYLLPALPPLFVLLSRCWMRSPPSVRQRRTLAVFAAAGLVATAQAATAPQALRLPSALRQAAAAMRVMDAHGVNGPVVTLSPELLPSTGRLPDARFATGPFYFRSDRLLPPDLERHLHLVSHRRAPDALATASAALVGGENGATGGDPRLDAALARAFSGQAYRIPDTGLVLLTRQAGRR